MLGIGGGPVSVTDGFRLRKNDEVFFCSVWVVEWCDSREGGAEGDLAWEENCDLAGVSIDGEDAVLLRLDFDDPNILLKKPGLSFACWVPDDGVPREASLDFS